MTTRNKMEEHMVTDLHAPLKIAVAQMVSGSDVDKNLSAAKQLIKNAAQQGAQVVILPENFYLMGKRESDKIDIAEPFCEIPTQATPVQWAMAQMACDHQVAVVAGTMPILASEAKQERKIVARSIFYNVEGRAVCHYDKRHLFDVLLPDGQESYLESKTIAAGEALQTLAFGQAVLGFAICYDLRFPEHFRALATRGANVIIVPSAFTYKTGLAHWHTLLRARAIENQCYVLAPNQGGEHDNGRHTFGHSVIYDPWGECMAELDMGEGLIFVTPDFDKWRTLSQHFPVLKHRRDTVG